MADDFIMGTETYTPQMGNMTTKGTSKLFNIIFIVDVSGSMRYDGRIEAVNEAFTQMIPALRQVQMDCMTEFELRIAIMTFDEEARWIVNPTPILEYNHQDITCSPWVTFFSRAFRTLGEKLTRSEFMAHTGKIAQPYIMFMTDGEPTEDDDYQPELDELLQNGWFKIAQRFAVLIGPDTVNSPNARAAVERFVTNTKEGIINASDAADIVAAVEAKTVHTVANMTQHRVSGVPNDSGDTYARADDSDSFGDLGGFGDFGGFDDLGGFDNDSFL